MSKCGFGSIHNTLIYPIIRTKSNGVANPKIETGIPMNDNKNVENDTTDTKCIGKVGPGLSFLEELIETVEAEESVETPDDGTGELATTFRWEGQVHNVGWEKASDVHFEKYGLEVVFTKFP